MTDFKLTGNANIVGYANILGNVTVGNISITNGISVGGGSGLALASGTVSAPTYTFTGETNTGFYKPATGNVGIAIQGTAALYATANGITAPGNVYLAPGTVATPALTFTGETGTGFYKPATGNVGIAIKGTAALYATANGITAPGNVYLAPGTVAAPVLTFTGETGTGFYKPATGNVGIAIQGTTALYATANGITAPGNVYLAPGTVAAPALTFTGETGTGWSKPSTGNVTLSIQGSAAISATSTTVSISKNNIDLGSNIYTYTWATGEGNPGLLPALQLGSGLISVNAPIKFWNDVMFTGNVKFSAIGSGVTASRALITDADGAIKNSVTTLAELSYSSGVTSSIQTQLNARANLASPSFTGTVTLPALSSVPASYALVTSVGNVVANSVTTLAELSYSNGVTSSIQTQLNARANLASPVFSGGILVTNGVASFPAGSAAAPSIANANETNTGVYFTNGNVGLTSVGTSVATFAKNTNGGSTISSNVTLSGNIFTTSLASNQALVIGPNGNIANSITTLAELAYSNGVTSSIQTQLNARATLASPSFSGGISLSSGVASFPAGSFTNPSINWTGGTTTGLYFTSSQVGLSSLGTSVATFAKNTSGGSTIATDLTVNGNVTINGITTTLNTWQLNVEDPVIVVNANTLANRQTGLYMCSPTSNVVSVFNPAQTRVEIFTTDTSPNSNAATFNNLGYASVRAGSILLDSGIESISLSGDNQYVTLSSTTFTPDMGNTSNVVTSCTLKTGSSALVVSNVDQYTTQLFPYTRVLGTFAVKGQLIVVPPSGTNKGTFIRTCEGGAFDTASTNHYISILGDLFKSNPYYGTSSAYKLQQTSAMGTLYVSTTNSNANVAQVKAGHAMISVLKIASEMDVMPITVHQSANLTTFTVGMTSDKGNVAIQTDSDCAITWQFYGSAF